MLFLLSPANANGRRAQMLCRAEAQFPLAVALRTEGAPLGDIYSFLSGLYFRGKLAYAARFGRALVIAPGRGLLPPSTVITMSDFMATAAVPVDAANPAFRDSLVRDARGLTGPVVLLGSVATDKYVDPLTGVFGDELLFPASFLGLGDMSRGALLLRSAASGEELEYWSIARRRKR